MWARPAKGKDYIEAGDDYAAELTWDKILMLAPYIPPTEDFHADRRFMTKFQFEITDKTQYKTFVWKDMPKDVKKED